jgi:DNA-binding MarR family transcriptional regulator
MCFAEAAASELTLRQRSYEAASLDTVHIHDHLAIMDDFSLCMVSNTRMAARAITRRYDALARPYGLTAAQFSLLATVMTLGEMTVSELAERRGFERTTLTRNLDRLEKDGLIASRSAEHGNGRLAGITDKGRAKVEDLLPVWRKAQNEVREALGPDGFDSTVATLQRLASL